MSNWRSVLRRVQDRFFERINIHVDGRAPTSSEAPAPATLTRELLSGFYLSGNGVEIGALNRPLSVPSVAHVTYIDRYSVADLRAHYPEFNDLPLVDPDIIDDGERLSKLSDNTQDFVIANHFLEHCEDPIGAFMNFLRVMKPNAVLYMALPEMTYNFDRDRPPTPLQHLIDDHEQGPGATREAAFDEWVRLVNKVQDESEVQHQKAHLMAINYSIHFHDWGQAEMFELIGALQRRYGLPFEVEAVVKKDNEVIFILRKLIK